MPGQRFMAVLTALILASGSTGTAQDYRLEELLEVERLMLSKDVDALLTYLQQNRHLTQGDDPFARELRFLQGQIEGQLVDTFVTNRNVDFEPQSGY